MIDTHAGIGRYDLASVAAEKTGEWRDGIGRILAQPLPGPVEEILAPYLDVVRGENAKSETPSFYPGARSSRAV